MGIYADQRIGELLRELPTGHGNRFSDTSETLKADALQEANISKSQAYDLQALAANPDVVQAVLDRAEREGTIPSRAQVLKAMIHGACFRACPLFCFMGHKPNWCAV